MLERALKIGKERIPELAALAVALIFALTVWLGTRYVDQADWVRHTLDVQTKIARIWSLIQDAEIGQRSFVLTSDDLYAAPCQRTPTDPA